MYNGKLANGYLAQMRVLVTGAAPDVMQRVGKVLSVGGWEVEHAPASEALAACRRMARTGDSGTAIHSSKRAIALAIPAGRAKRLRFAISSPF